MPIESPDLDDLTYAEIVERAERVPLAALVPPVLVLRASIGSVYPIYVEVKDLSSIQSA